MEMVEAEVVAWNTGLEGSGCRLYLLEGRDHLR